MFKNTTASGQQPLGRPQRETLEIHCAHTRCFAKPQVRYKFPVPLCSRHFVKVLAAALEVSRVANEEYEKKNPDTAKATRASKRLSSKAPMSEVNNNQTWVYYLQFGDRVKIGSTTNLKNRLASIPHDRVLALEPGGLSVERRRQNQFKHCHVSGDWFLAAPDLLAYAEQVRRENAAVKKQ